MTTTFEQRIKIKQLVSQGLTSRVNAEQMGLSIATVRKWRQRAHENLGSPMGRPAKGPMSSFGPLIRSKIKELRKVHKGWGPKTLLAELKRDGRFCHLHLPSRTAIARYLKAEGLSRSYERHFKEWNAALPPAERVHQRWQLDAKGNEQIQGVGAIAFINVKDVLSHCYSGIFPCWLPSLKHRVLEAHYRLALRLSFCQYGLPEELQLDHDSVFFDNKHSSPFPSLIHLWILALNINLVFSRVRQPQDQGQAERQHQTAFLQILSEQGYRNWEALYKFCLQRQMFLNYDLPCSSLGERAPLQVYPQAQHSGRLYSPELEPDLLNLHAVDAFLANQQWFRQVSQKGRLKLGNSEYYPEGAIPGSQLLITFDPRDRAFCFFDDNELLLDRKPVKGLTKENLIGSVPLYLPVGFQLRLPFSQQAQALLRLYETPPTTSL